jgi:hypothetical protein
MEVRMSKYDPLKAYLKLQQRDQIPMTFSEIEQVLGSKLPPSKLNRAWWSNNPDNSVITKAWLEAGYKTESVDIAGQKLVFSRVGPPQTGGLQESASAFSQEGRHPGFGFMKGLLTIEDGYDVTKPSDEVWDAGYLGFEEQK